MTPLVMLSVPGLRPKDLDHLESIKELAEQGGCAQIRHSFPCVTWPSQCNVLTGTTPDQHGIVANGFFWRDSSKVEMWTAWNKVIQRPQIWDSLKQRDPAIKTAAWFPMLAKGCGADVVCMPAPIHKPDGSEDMWCHTKPQEFYGDLLAELGHFPLQNFWGPLAGIQSTQWIVDSAIRAATEFRPDFWYIYLPHLDYAAQKDGPDSPQATTALEQLDGVVRHLIEQFSSNYGQAITWVVVSEYVIAPVDHVSFPNRMLSDAGLLITHQTEHGCEINFARSQAWALVDHQFSHVFVRDRDDSVIARVVDLFDGEDGFQMVVAGPQREHLNMDHERSGDAILISTPNSWQAYYWWIDDSDAPAYARTVDIHRKPGYDPVELYFDMATKSVPLDATLIKGSHGAPAVEAAHQGLLVCNNPGSVKSKTIADTAIHDLVLELMGS